MTRIFVTGINSFIGKELQHQCDEQGTEVIGIDLTGPFSNNIHHANFLQTETYSQLLINCDAVVHLAALSDATQCSAKPTASVLTNIYGTQLLLDTIWEAGVRHFVFASTEWVYTNFRDDETKDENSLIHFNQKMSEYALSKLTAEKLVEQFAERRDLAATILRFGIVYGPRDKPSSAFESLTAKVRDGNNIEVGSKATGRHFIHCKDIVSAILKSINLKGVNTLNVHGDKLITLEDVINTAAMLLNKSPVVKELSPTTPSIRRVSNKRAKHLLDWQPKYDLMRGVQSLLQHRGQLND